MRGLVGMLAVVIAAVAGCTSSGRQDLLNASAPAGKTYHGPMSVRITASGVNASVRERAGAAGRALECRYPPYGGGQGDYERNRPNRSGHLPSRSNADLASSTTTGTSSADNQVPQAHSRRPPSGTWIIRPQF